jgi:hypothetical protein
MDIQINMNINLIFINFYSYMFKNFNLISLHHPFIYKHKNIIINKICNSKYLINLLLLC